MKFILKAAGIALNSLFRHIRSGYCDQYGKKSVNQSDNGSGSDKDSETGEPEEPTGSKKEDRMNALTYMQQYMGAQLTGSEPPQGDLSVLITDKEKRAMEDTPFGLINEMLGLVVGLDDEEPDDLEEPTSAIRLTNKQIEILDVAHKKLLFALFHAEMKDLGEVYEFACTEEDFNAFIQDFPQA